MSDAPEYDPHARNRDTSIPRFFVEAVKNEFQSAQKGQPVFEDREMVEIIVPGDRSTISTRPVNEEIKRRWPREYKAFKENQDAPLDGTPIEQLPGITAARVEELRFSHVRTVEALADLGDEHLGRVVSMGGFSLRDQAKRWLETAAGGAPMEKLAAENAAKDEKMADMERRMKDMQQTIEALSAQRIATPQG